MKLLITGASGFVGRALSGAALQRGWHVRGSLLPDEPAGRLIPGVEPTIMTLPGTDAELMRTVAGVDTAIHLAARVHVMRENSANPLGDFRAVNTAGSLQLARQAALAGTKRFVFMSTIGVNGASTLQAFSELDEPAPHNPYSISKLEAENALREVGVKTGMEIVIIRAPLVYGPGNPGNFLTLMKFVSRMIPLPFGTVSNRRSLLYIDNLVDALCCCAVHPRAAGETYLVSDGEDISTPQLIRQLAAGMSKPAILLPVPVPLLRLGAKLLGRAAQIEQLSGSLTVDSSRIRRDLGWKPPVGMANGLAATARWFLDRGEDCP